MGSFLQISSSKPCMHLYCPPLSENKALSLHMSHSLLFHTFSCPFTSLSSQPPFLQFVFITSPYRFSRNKVTMGGRKSWVPLSAWVPGTLTQSIDHRHIHPRCHFAGATNLCTMSPNICGPSIFNLPHVSLLAPRILRWLVDLLETCTPLL